MNEGFDVEFTKVAGAKDANGAFEKRWMTIDEVDSHDRPDHVALNQRIAFFCDSSSQTINNQSLTLPEMELIGDAIIFTTAGSIETLVWVSAGMKCSNSSGVQKFVVTIALRDSVDALKKLISASSGNGFPRAAFMVLSRTKVFLSKNSAMALKKADRTNAPMMETLLTFKKAAASFNS
ncbi:hypothetical protein BVRB_027840 [Beta vulgaris subsp. vulgaris]|uniref:Uncharacterized protein n=1 Tax=Beta vulgaris subsp. vulgaris TaxID=3555 RepID=A0A0J8AY90_BETVV|nr:hypothetical protein BVRB_027840 [Beta vulgaris subsp. vulgaris]